MSTGFDKTSETPACAADIRYSSPESDETRTTLHFRLNSGSEVSLLAVSMGSPDFQLPSISTTSGIVASAVPSHCFRVAVRVTE